MSPGSAGFAHQVHDALAHLYDTVYLQTHPLAKLAGAEGAEKSANLGQVLRQSLIAAIETLRPSLDEQTNPAAWRSYHILTMRYVEGIEISDVQRRLMISKSAYYRASRQALQAVISVLRSRWRLEAGPPEPPAPGTIGATPADQGTTVSRRSAPPPRLPSPLTSFLGRQRELATVMRLLASSRLLTLTGAPGTGKTRLALEVAAQVADTFADGVVFVPLASVTDPALLLPTIVQATDVPRPGGESVLEALTDDLSNKRLLLILDNFEQIVAAAPNLIEILARCPELRMLVTSRVRLHLRGEREVAVPPLELPPVSVAGGVRKVLPTERRLEEYAAIALFVERARDVVPDFVITEETAGAIAEICYRLDGLPLAIELAAARAKLLPPASMLARLERRLPLLIGGPRDLPARQQTLRSAIAWSYDLLDGGDQRLLRRLAIFTGGATPDAAQAVCTDEAPGQPGGGQLLSLVSTDNLLDRLESLVSESLVVQTTISGLASEPELRFSLLETIREYALEQLVESGELASIQRRHAGHFLELAERAEPYLVSPQRAEWVSRLERENPNLQAAMDWWISQGDVRRGLRMASALVWFWALRGHLPEGRERMAALLASPSLAASSLDQAHALQIAATLAHHQRDFNAARALQEDSLRILRALGNQEELITALSVWGNILMQQGDYDAARAAFQENLAICQKLENIPGICFNLSNLGNIAHEQQDYAAARSLHEQCLEVCRAVQFSTGVAVQLHHLAMIAEDEGEFAEARALYEQSLSVWQADADQYGVARALLHLGGAATAQGDSIAAHGYLVRALELMKRMDDVAGIALVLERCARLAAAQQQPTRALTLAGAATALRERVGIPRPANVAAEIDAALSPAREVLGTTAAKAWAEGEALTVEQTISLATSPL